MKHFKYCPKMRAAAEKSILIVLAHLTCWSAAWPAVGPTYRRNYNLNTNYIPFQYQANSIPYETEAMDFQQSPIDNYIPFNLNQWERAREPVEYDLPEDYWSNQPSSFLDTEAQALSDFADMYDPPVWGQIVNEKPESELEELKAEEREREAAGKGRTLDAKKYHAYDFVERGVKRASPSSTTTPKPPTTTEGKMAATTALASSQPVQLKHHQPGQKEVPLLRPPSAKGRLFAQGPQKEEGGHHGNEDEPVIAVAQRSVAGEKPSAYDTLRKYLSLEDALKKEAEKRQSSNRISKRTPKGQKQIITDVDSLPGQLSNLKKSIL